MNIILILLVILIIMAFPCFARRNRVWTTFLDKNRTDSIKGMAALIVVIAHIFVANPWISEKIIGDGYTSKIIGVWGALGVSLFFSLSGYGCAFSIKKINQNFRAVLRWYIIHFFRIFIFFSISFAIVISICTVVSDSGLEVDRIVTDFFTLTIPGTSTWYLKIQILFYIFIASSIMINEKYRWILLCVLTLLYAIVAYTVELPDFWWKTSMSFPAGYIIADQAIELEKLQKAKNVMILLVFFIGISYFGILLDSDYTFLLQLILWPVLSACIIFLAQVLKFESRTFKIIGKLSLELYLIHIGLVNMSIFVGSDFSIALFLIVIAVATILAHVISKGLWKALQTKL